MILINAEDRAFLQEVQQALQSGLDARSPRFAILAEQIEPIAERSNFGDYADSMNEVELFLWECARAVIEDRWTDEHDEGCGVYADVIHKILEA